MGQLEAYQEMLRDSSSPAPEDIRNDLLRGVCVCAWFM